MNNELPFFPLKLVAFPGEDLNLHIFEPRYKQLVNDVRDGENKFGICTFLDKLMAIGTEVELVEVTNTYEDGRMDIKTKGMRSFRVLNFSNPMKEKLYAGGQVDFLPVSFESTPERHHLFKELLQELFRLMNHHLEIKNRALNAFTFAHKIGLKTKQEYELLEMHTENQRLDYLIGHFNTIIPLIKELESSKHKIKMNGHFKYLDPLNF